MKKIITLLSFVTLFTFCSKEQLMEESPCAAEHVFNISLPQSTRTCLGEKSGNTYPVLWSTGDCICVNEKGSVALTEAQAGKTDASFTVSGVSSPYRIVSPGSALVGGKICLPRVQTYNHCGYDPQVAIMTGYGTSLDTDLHNTVSYLKITIRQDSTEIINRIKVISNDDINISGWFDVDYTNSTLTYAENGRNDVSIQSSSSIPYDSYGYATAIIALPAGDYPSGFSVVVSDTQGRHMKRNAMGKGISMARGEIYPMVALTYSADDVLFSGGQGTEASPYVISTVEDFDLMNTLLKGDSYSTYAAAHYIQTADIDLGDTMYEPCCPISGKAFEGTYDGGGHVLSNFMLKTYDLSGSNATGLFAYLNGGVIRNLRINMKYDSSFNTNMVGTNNAAFVGYMTDGTVENCVLESNFLSNKGLYTAGIVSYMLGGTVRNCEMKGCVIGNAVDGSNYAYVGGIVSRMLGGLVDGCVMSGKVRADGKRVGGIVAYQSAGTIRNCKTTFGSSVYSKNFSVGGICSTLNGTSALVQDCEAYGKVESASLYCGGIAGAIRNGNIKGCTVGRSARVIGTEDTAGIVGFINISSTTSSATVDGCATYCDIVGSFGVGGICGYVISKGTGVRIINCVSGHNTITATSANPDNSYVRIGGIVGGIDKDGTSDVDVYNCCTLAPKLENTYTGSTTVYGFAGIVGSFFGKGNLALCYSTILESDFSYVASTLKYKGSIAGYFSPTSMNDTYYPSENSTFKATTHSKKTGYATGIALSKMTDGSLLANLNGAVSSVSGAVQWSADDSGHPIPVGTARYSGDVVKNPLRVSVLGASISTWGGYIPKGFSYYYPNNIAKDFSSVRQTYWYRLIYNYMTNACFDTNLSYSGTTVTNIASTEAGRNDFVQRYINNSGIGSPDIIILQGGTNDYSKVTYLYKTYTIASNSMPTSSEFTDLFATVDAATTMEQAKALPDTTFLEAYLKLVRMMTIQYPNVKIIHLIGDHIGENQEQSILKICEHYTNCKAVDMLAVNGFDGKTTNPDWIPVPKIAEGNIHPNPVGMDYIARKMYTELGSWLEVE